MKLSFQFFKDFSHSVRRKRKKGEREIAKKRESYKGRQGERMKGKGEIEEME